MVDDSWEWACSGMWVCGIYELGVSWIMWVLSFMNVLWFMCCGACGRYISRHMSLRVAMVHFRRHLVLGFAWFSKKKIIS